MDFGESLEILRPRSESRSFHPMCTSFCCFVLRCSPCPTLGPGSGCLSLSGGYAVMLEDVFIYHLLLVHWGLISNFSFSWSYRFFTWEWIWWRSLPVFFFFQIAMEFPILLLLTLHFPGWFFPVGPEDSAGTEASEALWGGGHHHRGLLAWYPGRPETAPQEGSRSGVPCGPRTPSFGAESVSLA